MKYDETSVQISENIPSSIPTHVAIIMDGNGRWAKKRLFDRVEGHVRGADVVRMAAETAREIGISYLTLFTFSTENWSRPKREINALMDLLRKFLTDELPRLLQNNIRFTVIGQIHRFPTDVQALLSDVMGKTEQNSAMTLVLALSYGGRDELTHAVKEIGQLCADGQLQPDEITEAVIQNHLFTKEMPDPDVLIRTSGEMRISNFLLWQLAYTEIFITPTLWPDFTKDEFVSILHEFSKRERRFGNI